VENLCIGNTIRFEVLILELNINNSDYMHCKLIFRPIACTNVKSIKHEVANINPLKTKRVCFI
jgi:hypothetical protein